MSRTPPIQFRLGEETLRQIDALASVWGGKLSPLHRAVVVRECVSRMYRRCGSPKPKTRRTVKPKPKG